MHSTTWSETDALTADREVAAIERAADERIEAARTYAEWAMGQGRTDLDGAQAWVAEVAARAAAAREQAVAELDARRALAPALAVVPDTEHDDCVSGSCQLARPGGPCDCACGGTQHGSRSALAPPPATAHGCSSRPTRTAPATATRAAPAAPTAPAPSWSWSAPRPVTRSPGSRPSPTSPGDQPPLTRPTRPDEHNPARRKDHHCDRHSPPDRPHRPCPSWCDPRLCTTTPDGDELLVAHRAVLLDERTVGGYRLAVEVVAADIVCRHGGELLAGDPPGVRVDAGDVFTELTPGEAALLAAAAAQAAALSAGEQDGRKTQLDL